jgi:hypothetical protein
MVALIYKDGMVIKDVRSGKVTFIPQIYTRGGANQIGGRRRKLGARYRHVQIPILKSQRSIRWPSDFNVKNYMNDHGQLNIEN